MKIYGRLYEKFGIFVDGFKFMPAYQLGRWDGKIRYVEKTGRTFVKLLEEIIPEVIAMGYEIEINDLRPAVKLVTERIGPDFFKDYGIGLRPYQYDTVNTLLDHTNGIARIATGGGKSFTCAALAQVLNNAGMRTLIIVPSGDLVTQTSGDFAHVRS